MFVPMARDTIVSSRRNTRRQVEVGDVRMVQSMSIARRLGRRKRGYSYDYVRYVLAGKRYNAAILALHDELVALRTPNHQRR